MFKKVLNIMKDSVYEDLAEQDAVEIAKRFGNQVAIEAYLKQHPIPARKSAYAIMYDKLLAALDEKQAEGFYQKKFQFVERQNVTVLWEMGSSERDTTTTQEHAAQERAEKETIIAEISAEWDEKIAIQQEQLAALRAKEKGLLKELQLLADGKKAALAPYIKQKEAVQGPTTTSKKETKKEESELQEDLVHLIVEEGVREESFVVPDPTLREEGPPVEEDIEDAIMKGF